MRALILISVTILVSACSVVGGTGTSTQMHEAQAVNAFIDRAGPYGHRLAAGNAVYQPRLHGLNPYFGR